MVAFSQNAEDDERRALEQELAAELAALSAQDVGFDESFDEDDDQNDVDGCVDGEAEKNYVRLDLDTVLKQVSNGSVDEVKKLHDHSDGNEDHRVTPTSWELLLQSVERNDREFFQPYHENLHKIRSLVFGVQCPNSLVQHSNDQAIEVEILDQVIFEFATHPEKSSTTYTSHVNEEQVNSQSNNDSDDIMDSTIPSAPSVVVELAHADRNLTLTRASDLSQAVPVSDVYHSTFIAKNTQSEDDQIAQKQLQTIARQHGARELRRRQAHTRYEKERDEAAQLLLRLQEEFETQQRQAEITRHETLERSLMSNEEIRCRWYAAAQREADEMLLMKIADNESCKFATELERIQNEIREEITQMEAEDQAEWHRMQAEREAQFQRQMIFARRLFNAVLSELIKYQEIQQQLRDQQTKRERRECVRMRAEEASLRRVLLETRAIQEQKERDRNRALMLRENELAKAFEDQERRHTEERLREEKCRIEMEKEEFRSRCAWSFIEYLDLMQKQNEEHSCVIMEQEELRCRQAWICQAKLVEAQEKEREQQDEIDWAHAAMKIQMWHRSCRHRIQHHISVEPPLVLEDITDDEEQPQIEEDEEDNNVEQLNNEDYSYETQEAALRLQSTFRGFHVRRKFANALALAQTVEHEGDSFDAVDLDDLIELPPELEDGWEDPVLPPTSSLSRRQHPPIPQQLDRDEEMCDQVENNDLVDGGSLDRCKPVVKGNVAKLSATKEPPKEQNLAMQLWNKMKRVKNRQQHNQQERQRQQDPIYRMQKLLNRKSSIHIPTSQHGNSTNNQSSDTGGNQKVVNMVSWSSSNAKRKPKVKLPSLVERLRNQTMAER